MSETVRGCGALALQSVITSGACPQKVVLIVSHPVSSRRSFHVILFVFYISNKKRLLELSALKSILLLALVLFSFRRAR